MPLILESAASFWTAAEHLAAKPREAEVLSGFAEEEAAKIHILFDIVRCPRSMVDQRIGDMIRSFYSHLARRLYAQAQRWRPGNFAELRRYVDHDRRAHCLDGFIGEFIAPNGSIWARESQLYVDVEAHDDDEVHWSSPNYTMPCFGRLKPDALQTAQALHAVGAFQRGGLAIVLC